MPLNENSALFDNDLLSIFLVICLAFTEKSLKSNVFCIAAAEPIPSASYDFNPPPVSNPIHVAFPGKHCGSTALETTAIADRAG
ncbi:hypothetical protein NG726_26710 [Pseudomonas sp. MOB-449]|nr:hypothetical protein [Pseudomonas sp. MOB-449]